MSPIEVGLDLLQKSLVGQQNDLRVSQEGQGLVQPGKELLVAHPLAQTPLDLEALGCLDIFQINSAEALGNAGDSVHELVHIGRVHFHVDGVDSRETLEQ